MRYLFLILTLLVTAKSIACDCIGTSEIRDNLVLVDFVFTGTVVELVRVRPEEIEVPEFLDTIPAQREKYRAMFPEQFFARVVMLDNIKGNAMTSDTLFFISEFSNCDPTYELNQSYLFFADSVEGGRFMMSHCTPWGKLEDCGETIEKLTEKK